MSRSRQVARNVLVTLATQLISWGLTFAVMLFLPRYVGDAGLGSLAFAASFVAVIGAFVPLGTSTVLIKEIARDHARVADLLPAAVLLRVPLGLLATGLAIAAVSALGYSPLTRLLVTVASLGLIVVAVNDALGSALQGLENFSRQSAAFLLEKFLSSGLTIFLVLVHAPLWELAAVGLFTGTVSLVVRAASFSRLWPALRLPAPATLRFLVTAGMPFLGYGLFNSLYGQTEPNRAENGHERCHGRLVRRRIPPGRNDPVSAGGGDERPAAGVFPPAPGRCRGVSAIGAADAHSGHAVRHSGGADFDFAARPVGVAAALPAQFHAQHSRCCGSAGWGCCSGTRPAFWRIW